MSYLILYGIFAIWVYLDAVQRKTNAIPWAVGTVILGPLVLPVYIAKRPLKTGEIREGGTGWNVLKNFAIFWTILMVVVAVWGVIAVGQQSATLQTDVEKAGAALGTAVGLGMIGAIWFFPMVGAVLLGFMLKKSSIVEKGPTSSLAVGSDEGERSVPPETSSGRLKSCPKCSRQVLRAAVKCPFCRYVF